MKLNKGQKEKLLQWVGEGLESGEINKRASTFDPPFQVSRTQVDFYRKTRAVRIKEITQAGELDALTTGLANKGERVRVLKDLAERMIADLTGDSLWVSDVKAVNNEPVYITRFNASEMSELRQVLDQIASETGDKKPESIIPSEIHVRFVKPEGQP